MQIAGCFALTEIAHGTDAKRMRTTAVYDPQAKQFILHTEDFQAAKCWIGNLGELYFSKFRKSTYDKILKGLHNSPSKMACCKSLTLVNFGRQPFVTELIERPPNNTNGCLIWFS